MSDCIHWFVITVIVFIVWLIRTPVEHRLCLFYGLGRLFVGHNFGVWSSSRVVILVLTS